MIGQMTFPSSHVHGSVLIPTLLILLSFSRHATVAKHLTRVNMVCSERNIIEILLVKQESVKTKKTFKMDSLLDRSRCEEQLSRSTNLEAMNKQGVFLGALLLG